MLNAAQGNNYPTQNPTKPATALENFESQISALADAVQENNSRLRHVLDRAHGPAPQSGEKDGPKPVPNGVIGSINERLSSFSGALSEQVALLARLETII